MKKVNECIGLLSSMISCGEKHSEVSRKVISEAKEELSKLKNKDEEIKIFDMDNGITWVAAKDRLDALVGMAKHFWSYSDAEFGRFLLDQFSDVNNKLDFSQIKEISEEDYTNLKFAEDDEDGNERKGEVKTFRQKLDEMIEAKEEFPCFFATSEY